MGTGVAATALGRTRYAIAKAVEEGRLPGYGIRSRQRTRWYVYEDVLDRSLTKDPDDVAAERDHYRARASAYEEVVLRLLSANERRREADGSRSRAVRLLAEALEATAAADQLYVEAEQAIDDALRQIVLPTTAIGE